MFILIDKPKGITSHDVIDSVRKITGEERVGHAGTLDPNATGLLIVGVGRESTRDLGTVLKNKKTYLAEIILGEERDTDDVEGEVIVTNSKSQDKISKEKIVKILKGFVGEQIQTPPSYSAIRIKGKKSYELARKGIKVELSPRKVLIYSIKLQKYKYPKLQIETEVSSGTYIRALARDIGRKLGYGAYINNLRRIRIENFKIEDSVSLERLNRDNWKSFALSYLSK